MNGGSASGAFYPVERVVASRKRKRHTEYLVLWEGYRREESSWVPEADVTATAKRERREEPIRGHGKNYYKDDFAERYFPSGWHIVHDHLGDGCQVDFPIRLHSKLRWSSVVYHKSEDGTLTRKLQSFTEVLVVNVVKKRC
ncbi:hypothetical protein EMCRGX_G020807 [Ephydatia muelleri]